MEKIDQLPSTAVTELGPVNYQDSAKGLSPYLDGWLEGPDASRLRTHLATCDTCGDQNEFQVELKRLVATHCRTEIPDDVKHRLLAALETADSENDQLNTPGRAAPTPTGLDSKP